MDVDQELLFELILAANYMDIKPLLDLTCATVASMIKGKTPEEIRAQRRPRITTNFEKKTTDRRLSWRRSQGDASRSMKTAASRETAAGKTFNIVNDFTPEEEAQVREENKWCEEA